jgi:hypothetical protein
VRPVAVGLLAACALAALTASAAAQGIDRAGYERLVAAAAHDPAALARLRAVTDVAGQPVDLYRVLSGSPARVRARLAVLRAAPSARAPGAAASRHAAAAILAGPAYRPARPGALARALAWLARELSIPVGGNGVFGLVVLGLAAAVIAALGSLLVGAVRRSRRRGRESPGAGDGALGVGSASPEELERRASAAEAAGRFEEAMRLQLAAALTRLDAGGAIRVRRDTTIGEVSRSLHSQHFDAAAVRFAGVVYGRRPPTGDDALELRRQLAATLAERGRE